MTRAQNAEAAATAAIATESARAASAEGALSSSLAGEVSRATAAEGVLTGNLNSEISQAESAEATKANIDAPIKVDPTAAVDTGCAGVNGMALNPGQPSGRQVFVCRQSDPNDVSTRKWALVNDDRRR